nr:MAG TPA: hypothetical protein [Caudoviricetes sp.]
MMEPSATGPHGPHERNRTMSFDDTVTITDGPGKGATLTVDTEYPYTINVTAGDRMALIDGPWTSDPLTAAVLATIAH